MHNPGRAKIADKQKFMDAFEETIRTLDTMHKDRIMDLFR